MSVILDASAILAVILEEAGADNVLRLARNSLISTVNMVEVLQKSAERNMDGEPIRYHLARLDIAIVPFEWPEAQIAAALVPKTRRLGISLGDRACLALGLSRNLPVLTADRAWAQLDIGVDIRLIR
jgi:ribonuclease VapC